MITTGLVAAVAMLWLVWVLALLVFRCQSALRVGSLREVRALGIEGRRHGVHVNAITPYAYSQMTVPYLQSAVAQWGAKGGEQGWDAKLCRQCGLSAINHRSAMPWVVPARRWWVLYWTSSIDVAVGMDAFPYAAPQVLPAPW